jgi:short subunit dehydrogenase-like uncharacterized protein
MNYEVAHFDPSGRYNERSSIMNVEAIAIYGATGHTGRLMTHELATRGHKLVLAGRNRQSLIELASKVDAEVEVRVADLDDSQALQAVTENTSVVINCAGPFSRSGEAVARASLKSGSHYLDHAAEPLYVKRVFDELQGPAREAGTVVIPGMSFYGATSGMLASLVADGLEQVDNVTIAYYVTGWLMTAASKYTAVKLANSDRLAYANGKLEVVERNAEPEWFEFPAPIGWRQVLANYPAGEVITVPRSIPTSSVDVFMTVKTFQEDGVFTSENLDATERNRSEFTIVAHVRSSGNTRVGHLFGKDIYQVGALIATEAAVRLADGYTGVAGGVFGAAEVFNPEEFIADMQRLNAFETTF